MTPIPARVVLSERWRGFNLTGMFDVNWSDSGFKEKDFRMIADLGFNFVRLPLDYRTYTSKKDWYSYKESELARIDQAVAWGRKYGIHVCINLHRAPGYCVNSPSEPLPPDQDKDLWHDKNAWKAFAAHWKMFAKRYKGVPGKALSFNLLNEPSLSRTEGDIYAAVMNLAVKQIRKIDPDRIIIIDGLRWANDPCFECVPAGAVQAAHFYEPFRLTHYKARWIEGSDTWPEPAWPPVFVSQYLYGPVKKEFHSPFVLYHEFPAGTKITVKVHQVSDYSKLCFYGDDSLLYEKSFSPGPGEGEWSEVQYAEEWKIYQNIYDKSYSVVLKQLVFSLSIENTEGDWLTISEIRITPDKGKELVFIPDIGAWGVPQAEFIFDEQNNLIVKTVPGGFEDYYRGPNDIIRWQALEQEGIPVFIGEWGVYSFTPHDVTLAFMEDQLKKMKQAGYGWALWNFRGPFGIFDSGREDVAYEEYNGHKLDRKMLTLLQKY